MDELLTTYADKFGDNFPLWAVKSLEEYEIANIIKESLNSGKPYEANYNEDTLY